MVRQRQGFHFDWTMNLGHVLIMLGFLVPVGAVIVNQSNFQTATTIRLEIMEKDAPKIEALLASQITDNSRFSNVDLTLVQLRTTIEALNSTNTAMLQRLTALETILKAKNLAQGGPDGKI